MYKDPRETVDKRSIIPLTEPRQEEKQKKISSQPRQRDAFKGTEPLSSLWASHTSGQRLRISRHDVQRAARDNHSWSETTFPSPLAREMKWTKEMGGRTVTIYSIGFLTSLKI